MFRLLFSIVRKCNCLCLCLLVGHLMSPHHSDQMSQRSQVSRIALWRCSLNVFVFVIVFVFVFVFVFVIVFFWSGHVSSSLWSHVSRVTSFSECSMVVFFKSVSQSVSESVSDEATYRAVPLFSEGKLKIKKSTNGSQLCQETTENPNDDIFQFPLSLSLKRVRKSLKPLDDNTNPDSQHPAFQIQRHNTASAPDHWTQVLIRGYFLPPP